MTPTLLLLSLLATTREVERTTTSPVGIEETLLAISTGAYRESPAVRSAILSLLQSDTGTTRTIPAVSVWLDGQLVNVSVLTNFREFRRALEGLRQPVPYIQSIRRVCSALTRLIASVDRLVALEMRLRGFLADDIHPECRSVDTKNGNRQFVRQTLNRYVLASVVERSAGYGLDVHCPGERPNERDGEESASSTASPRPVFQQSIEYAYSFNYKGMFVRRRTYIEDDYLRLTTKVSGNLGRLQWAKLVIEAREMKTVDPGSVAEVDAPRLAKAVRGKPNVKRPDKYLEHRENAGDLADLVAGTKNPAGTRITATLTAHTPTRCRMVGRIVARIMDREMPKVLYRIETRGRQFGESGATDLRGAVRLFLDEIVGGLR